MVLGASPNISVSFKLMLIVKWLITAAIKSKTSANLLLNGISCARNDSMEDISSMPFTHTSGWHYSAFRQSWGKDWHKPLIWQKQYWDKVKYEETNEAFRRWGFGSEDERSYNNVEWWVIVHKRDFLFWCPCCLYNPSGAATDWWLDPVHTGGQVAKKQRPDDTNKK